MQHVLITGANGFIGAYLVNELLARNFIVIATGRGDSRLPFRSNKLVYESMDFTNEAEVTAVFEKYRPTIVIHSGAMSKPDECEINREAAFRTNVSGTVNLLSNARRIKSFFYFSFNRFCIQRFKRSIQGR